MTTQPLEGVDVTCAVHQGATEHTDRSPLQKTMMVSEHPSREEGGGGANCFDRLVKSEGGRELFDVQ